MLIKGFINCFKINLCNLNLDIRSLWLSLALDKTTKNKWICKLYLTSSFCFLTYIAKLIMIMTYKSYLVATVFLLLLALDCIGQNIVRGPYLQLNTPTSIIIRWRTDSPTDSKLWYGDSHTNLTSTLEIGHFP